MVKGLGLAHAFSNPGLLITNIILLVVALQILVSTIPTIISSIINLSTITTNISGTSDTAIGLSFASFFAANGVVLLGLSAVIVIGILSAIGLIKGGKR